MSLVRIAWRIAAYAWASPNRLIGLVAGLAVLPCGGTVRIVRGRSAYYDSHFERQARRT